MSNSDSESGSAQSEQRERESLIEQFKNVVGASNESAKAILEACNWNLELAINMQVDGIQSNDLAEIPINRSTTNNVNSSVSSQTNSNSDVDFVRAPIPPVRQVLVEEDYQSVHLPRRPLNNVFDVFRDFQAEARWQEELQNAAVNGESSLDTATMIKKQTLEDLFRPPLDIMFRGTFESSKDEGTRQNRWLLVNIQNAKEFACQVLNRDVWSNPTIKEIIKEHFIFWQINHDQVEGQRFCQYYNINEFPNVSILDPRTGEKLRSFSAGDVDSLCEFITEFINEHPTPNGNAPSKSDKATTSTLPSSSRTKIYDQSEEAQLEAAIAASLKEIDNQKNNDSSSSDTDDCQVFEDAESDRDKNNEVLENWKDFLAPEDGKEAQFKIRLPDGSIDQISFPANSQIKALFLYISSKGFDTKRFDLTTAFPRIKINDLNSTDTMIQANLYPRTTIHIQEKS